MKHSVITFIVLTVALAGFSFTANGQTRSTSAGTRPVIHSKSNQTVTEKGLGTPQSSGRVSRPGNNSGDTGWTVSRGNVGNNTPATVSRDNNQGKLSTGKTGSINLPTTDRKIERRQIERPQIERPQVERPQVERPQVERPQVERPQVERPQIERRQSGAGGNTPGAVSRREVRPGDKPGYGVPSNFHGGKNPRPVIMDNHRDIARVHPRDRGYVRTVVVNNFWRPGVQHYFGYRVEVIPTACEVHTYFGRKYYYFDGIWYRDYVTNWVVCRPPFGYSFAATVANITFNTCLFAYYCDVNRTFNTINENAAIITRQNEQIARNNAILAQQNETLAMNQKRASNSYNLANSLGLVQRYADASQRYFYEDGVFYSQESDGKYVVIVPPAGALVNTLPDDYEVYTVNDREFYRVDDTLYRMVVVDGSPYFEVLGQFTE